MFQSIFPSNAQLCRYFPINLCQREEKEVLKVKSMLRWTCTYFEGVGSVVDRAVILRIVASSLLFLFIWLVNHWAIQFKPLLSINQIFNSIPQPPNNHHLFSTFCYCFLSFFLNSVHIQAMQDTLIINLNSLGVKRLFWELKTKPSSISLIASEGSDLAWFKSLPDSIGDAYPDNSLPAIVFFEDWDRIRRLEKT